LGKHSFHQVRYSHLVRASDWQHWSKKTYNNAISVIRRAFEFGYRDHPELPYDEFRFFTGLRPSEQIALMLSDIDLKQGVVSVNKACVAGIDRDCAKTGEDRCVQARQNLVIGLRQQRIQQAHQHVPELRALHPAQAPALSPLRQQFIDDDRHLPLLLAQLQAHHLEFGRDALVMALLAG
jgi:integrase